MGERNILQKHIIAPILPFLFFTGAILYSDVLLEFGAFSSEIGQHGYHTFAWLRLIIYAVLSIAVYFVLVSLLFSRTPPEMDQGKDKYLLAVFLACLVFYSVPIFMHGPAFWHSMNRYEYMQLDLVSFFNIKLFIGCMCFSLGLVARTSGEMSLFARGGFLLTIVIMMLYGEKFSGPFTATIYFTIGLLVGSTQRQFSFFKLGLTFFVCVAFLLSIYLIWGLTDSRDLGLNDVIVAFLDRSARQAQVWWKLDELVNIHGGGAGIPILYQLNYSNYSEFNLLGNLYLKEMLMPHEEYVKHPGSLAAAYPAILYLNNNFIGFILWAIGLNVVYWLVIIFMFNYSVSRPLIYLMPVFIYWYTVHLKIFQTGNLYLFTHPKYLLGLVTILGLLFCMRFLKSLEYLKVS